jgi:hypothetical protein
LGGGAGWVKSKKIQFYFKMLMAFFLYKMYLYATYELYKNTNHQQMHKESFIINRNTLLHVSTLLGHLQGELFCYRYPKLALYI